MSNAAPVSPTPPSTGSDSARTRTAIAQAAQATGTDFGYLMAQAQLESGMDPQARARTSSASGLYQFIDSTWLRTLDRHGPAHGLTHIADAIEQRGGRAFVRDPAMRQQIMDLRYDPQVAAIMAGALAQDNHAALRPVLGREPDPAELYLAHFLGAGGATRFLQAMARDPHGSAAALLPAAAAANRGIFYAHGQPRSLTQVMEVIEARMDRASGSQTDGAPLPAGWAASPVPDRPPQGTTTVMRTRRDMAGHEASMARMLEDSFGLGRSPPHEAGRAPAHVQAAYAKLTAFAL